MERRSFQVNLRFDGRWDDNSNYTNFRSVDIYIHEDMNFEDVLGVVIPHLESVGIYEMPVIYFCMGPNEVSRQDMHIFDDKDVKWLLGVLSNNTDHKLLLIACSNDIISGLINHVPQSNRFDDGPPLVQSLHKSINFDRIHPDLKIVVNDAYTDKSLLQNVVRAIAIRDNFRFKTKKSTRKFLVLVCIVSDCKWVVRASCSKAGNRWIVNKVNDIHSCNSSVVHHKQTQASASVIKECIKSKIGSTSRDSCSTQEIVSHMSSQYGITIQYNKAWRARELALNDIRGLAKDSYKKLPQFGFMVQKKMPGSFTNMEVDLANRFKYFYMAFACSIKGWKYCRPIISVDGTFLKNKYAGTLLVASSVDGNGQIYPIGFGIVDSENDNSWEWFLLQLRSSIGERDQMVFVSDRHKSIQRAIQLVFPSSVHGFCIYHLLKNLKLRYKNKLKDNLFLACAKAYTIMDYEYYMRELESNAPGIMSELEEIGVERWARAYFESPRYRIMTTNISESLNAVLREAREFPVVTLLEFIRRMLQKWFFQRRAEAQLKISELSKWAEKEISTNTEESRTMRMEPINNDVYVVYFRQNQFTVDLPPRTCTCCMWQAELIPCPHACYVLCNLNLPLKQYTSPFFLNSWVSLSYEGIPFPLGDISSWQVPEEVSETEVLPPNVKRSAGRPKKLRVPSVLEAKQRIKCGRCGRYGHNRKSCRFSIPEV